MKRKEVFFKNVVISVICANGEPHEYHSNNNFINYTEGDIIELFDLEELPTMATEFEGLSFGDAFNTYNWAAPFTFAGVYPRDNDIYGGPCLVSIHLGGDARGNYSRPYICKDAESIFSQQSYLYVELSNGRDFNFDCENGEAYFAFDTFDPYWIDFDSPITEEQLSELEEKSER